MGEGKGDADQKLAPAGTRHALSRGRQKQGAMGCATQEPAVRIHELIGEPVEGHTQVRAAVVVYEKRMSFAHDYIAPGAEIKTSGTTVWNVSRPAKDFHAKA